MDLHWRDVALPGGPPISTSVTAAETAELQRLALGGRVLEIGSAYGYSTVALAQVAERVVAVDPHTWLNSLPALRANLAAYGVTERVEVRVGSVEHLFTGLEGPVFDGAFIDGDHSGQAVERDIRLAVALVKPGGWIACHDHGETTCPDVGPVCDRLIPGGKITDTLYVVTR